MGDACATKGSLEKTVQWRPVLWTVVHMVSAWMASASALMVSLVKIAHSLNVPTIVLVMDTVGTGSVFVINPGVELTALNSYVPMPALTAGAVKMAPASVTRGLQVWAVEDAPV